MGSEIPESFNPIKKKMWTRKFTAPEGYSLDIMFKGYNNSGKTFVMMTRDKTSTGARFRNITDWVEVPQEWIPTKTTKSEYLLLRPSLPARPLYKIIKDMPVKLLEPIKSLIGQNIDTIYKRKCEMAEYKKISHMVNITVEDKLNLYEIWEPVDGEKIFIFTVKTHYPHHFIYADTEFLKNIETSRQRHLRLSQDRQPTFIEFLKNFAYMALTGLEPVSAAKKKVKKKKKTPSTPSTFIEFLKNFAYMALTGIEPEPSQDNVVVSSHRQPTPSNFIEFLKNFAYMALTGLEPEPSQEMVVVSSHRQPTPSNFIKFLKNFAYMALTGLELEPSQGQGIVHEQRVTQGPETFESLFNISGNPIIKLKKKKLSNTSTVSVIVKAWLENQINIL